VKVCLDTNVLVAAFATRGLCADVLRTVLAEHELIVGEVILTEFRHALTQKLKAPRDRIAAAEAVLTAFPVLPKPAELPPGALPIRDHSDRWILATAVAGGAEVLVTGDHDLLSVDDASPIRIVTPRAFWELLRSGASG